MNKLTNNNTLSLSFLSKRFEDRVVHGKSSLCAGGDSVKSADDEEGEASQGSSELEKTKYYQVTCGDWRALTMVSWAITGGLQL